MHVLNLAKNRYTCKGYDASRVISDADFAALMETVRLSPSSVNSQPWEFFVAKSAQAKNKIQPAVAEFNVPRIQECSHVVVVTVHNTIDDDYLHTLAQQEYVDGRYQTIEAYQAQIQGRGSFVKNNMPTDEQRFHWQARQAYIAMGCMLLAAADLGIDATPLEGINCSKMDEILNLKQKGLRTVYAVALGYRGAQDWNKDKPKSRWSMDRILHTI